MSAVIALERLTLSAFRSYGALDLTLDSRPVVLTGPNGAGKTNILEAVSLLAPGKGLRGAGLGDLVRKRPEAAPDAPQAEGWAVAARLRSADGSPDPVRIGTGLEPSTGRTPKRSVRIDGEPARSTAALGAHVRAMWLTPAMDRLFLEGAGGRRRFLDRLVLAADPGHGARAAAYEKAMRERTRLLKTGGGDPAWLSALEAAMAEAGTALDGARMRFVADLAQAARLAAEAVPEFPRAELLLDAPLAEQVGGDGGPEDLEARFAAMLGAMRGRDGAAGRALTGPHRSDLAVTHGPKAMPARDCSTGEQKALLIGIVLAAARLRVAAEGVVPLLLLDEVAAHLDTQRRAALWSTLGQLGAQAWMTGTDDSLFAALGPRAQYFTVCDGRLTPREPSSGAG